MTQRIRNQTNALAPFNANEDRALFQVFGFLMSAYKKLATSVAGSTTLVADPDMWTELYGAGQHKIDIYLPISSITAAGGVKFAFVADQGLTVANISMQVEYLITGVAPVISNIAALGASVNGGTTNAYTAVRITGSVDVINGGVLQLQVAQQAASGAVTFAAGAYLRAEQLTSDATF